MRETPSPTNLTHAQAVYDYMVRQPLDAMVQVSVISAAIGLTYPEVVTGMHWAQRVICPTTGVYLGSKKGPAGGYFVTTDKATAADDESRWLAEQWTTLKKVEGKTLTRKKARLGNRNTIREVNDAVTAAINTVENALEKHGRFIGHVAHDRERDGANH